MYCVASFMSSFIFFPGSVGHMEGSKVLVGVVTESEGVLTSLYEIY